MKIGLTGVPGWLTSAVLGKIQDDPASDVTDVRVFAHPAQEAAAIRLRERFSCITRVVPLSLENVNVAPADLDGLDVLLHTAAVIHVKRPKEWITINHGGTMALAEAARASGVKRFVFVSSNAAGGRNESRQNLLTEDDEPHPLSVYGESKLLSERGLRDIEAAGGPGVVILRPSMFYGPPVPGRHIDIYKRILGGSMPMVGDGAYRRSITYIDNLVQATFLAMHHPAASGNTYYVVDDPVYTTRSIVDAMAEALGVRPKYIRLPEFVGPLAHEVDAALTRLGLYIAPVHLLGEATWDIAISNDKLRRELGYRPTVELDEGMHRAIAWCRANGAL